MGQIVGKQGFLALMILLVMGASLFAHEKGDLVVIPEVQAGLEIPNIHQKNEYGKGDYVSLGLDWGSRVTAGYYFLDWLAAGAGIGFGGFYDTNNYNARDTASSHTETHTYNAGYLILPAGLRVNRGRLAAGAGLTGHIPVFFTFSGESRQTVNGQSVKSGLHDDSFRIHPFIGGYVDIGYDWAGQANRSQGFGVFLRAQFPFDDNIAESDAGYRKFQHASISLIVSYCFKILSAPLGK
ncbi:hypothetical protein AGMMS49546_06380 [Spirochaetia bacterium]|nr:hypothetical protein AGMMS49546_06380 [Spirochaetia bacterium]